MKIFFYQYGSLCEPDIIQSFKELGHEVITCDLEIRNKAILPSMAVKHVSNQLLEQPVDCVFSINFFPYIADMCRIFHIRYLCWTVDSPVIELYSNSITSEWNRIFLFDQAQIQDFREFNPERIFYLPLAANVHNKESLFLDTSKEIHQKYTHDIAFVGSLYSEKCPYDLLANAPSQLTGYLDGIMAAQEKVYGYYFIDELLSDAVIEEFKQHYPSFYEQLGDTFLTDRDTLSQLYIGNKITANERKTTFEHLCKFHQVDIYTGSDTSQYTNMVNHGYAKTLTEMPLIFHNSKININTTSKSIRSGLPLRIFDILSCGGFVLTNYQNELNDLFHYNEDLVAYGSMDEMCDLAAYYLEHENERKEIAHNGLETIKKYHTYEIRLSQMLELAFSI